MASPAPTDSNAVPAAPPEAPPEALRGALRGAPHQIQEAPAPGQTPPKDAPLPATAPAPAPAPASSSAGEAATAEHQQPKREPEPGPIRGNTASPPATAVASSPATTPGPSGPYTPQFTAATEMILKRMRGESSPLSAALSSAPGARPAGTIKPSTYEDVRRRLVSGMTVSTGSGSGAGPGAGPNPASGSSMTMQMPEATPAPMVGPEAHLRLAPPHKKQGTAQGSIIRRISSGIVGKGAPAGGRGLTKAGAVETKRLKAAASAAARAGMKRKRVKGQDGGSWSSLSETETEGRQKQQQQQQQLEEAAPLTMTKSGRHVTKPTAYNPAAMDSATKKRAHYGKRTPEEILCKWCTRWAYTDDNQMVFCDGCNDGWHQRCHEPWISDEIVRDPSKNWYCKACQEKRERESGGKKKTPATAAGGSSGTARGSWAGKTAGQRRAYLSGLSHGELVNILVHCTDLHPDLPIFPIDKPSQGSGSSSTPKSLFAGATTDGLFTRAEANPNGPINFIRKVSNGSNRSPSKSKAPTANGMAHKPATLVSAESTQNADEDDEDDQDPFVKFWPRPGRGMYSRLPPEQDDPLMVDKNDYEAFSHIVYDEKGRKVAENGMEIVYDDKSKVVEENGKRVQA